jgi:hypothetical protein
VAPPVLAQDETLPPDEPDVDEDEGSPPVRLSPTRAKAPPRLVKQSAVEGSSGQPPGVLSSHRPSSSDSE